MSRLPIGKHGRDHRPAKALGPTDPGGHDPINASWFINNGGYATYPMGVRSFSSLMGYWPLTDGAPPYADISGLSPAAPAALSAGGTSPLMTQHLTPGPLAVGDAGAVAFNSVTTSIGERLYVAEVSTPRRFNLDSGDWSIAFWCKPTANAGTWNGPIVSDYQLGGVSGMGGWQIYCAWPSLALHFAGNDAGSPSTGFDLSGGVVPSGWVHVVATFQRSTGSPLRSVATLYYNGAAVGNANAMSSGSPATLSLPTWNLGFTMGYGLVSPTPTYGGFDGGLAHVAIWDTLLSGANVATLYASGNVAGAGSSVVADGSGGFTYGALSGVTVYKNGV